jgi:hypothetical protein
MASPSGPSSEARRSVCFGEWRSPGRRRASRSVRTWRSEDPAFVPRTDPDGSATPAAGPTLPRPPGASHPLLVLDDRPRRRAFRAAPAPRKPMRGRGGQVRDRGWPRSRRRCQPSRERWACGQRMTRLVGSRVSNSGRWRRADQGAVRPACKTGEVSPRRLAICSTPHEDERTHGTFLPDDADVRASPGSCRSLPVPPAPRPCRSVDWSDRGTPTSAPASASSLAAYVLSSHARARTEGSAAGDVTLDGQRGRARARPSGAARGTGESNGPRQRIAGLKGASHRPGGRPSPSRPAAHACRPAWRT